MAYQSKNPKFDSEILKDQGVAAVVAPASGSHKVIDRNGSLYIVDSSGNETPVGGGAGEINEISAPNTAAGAVASGAGITVATTTTAADLPLNGIISTAIKITPVSGTDYVRWRWTAATSLKNRRLKIQWAQLAAAGYLFGDLKVDLYVNSASNYGGSYTRVPLENDSSAVSSIPNGNGTYTNYFTSDASDYYELRIGRVSGTTALNIVNLIIGPGIQPQGAVGSYIGQLPFTAGAAFGSVTGLRFDCWRNNSLMKVVASWTNGTLTGATASAGLPSGYHVDSTVLSSSSKGTPIGTWENAELGSAQGLFSGGNAGPIFYDGSDTSNIYFALQASTSGLVKSTGTGSFAGSRYFTMEFTIPIAEWASSGLNIGTNDIQYLTNTSTSTTASDTSSFLSSPAGSPIQNITAALTRRCRSAAPLAGKDIYIQINEGTGWVTIRGFSKNAQNINEYVNQAGTTYGIASTVAIINDTDFDVNFGQYAFANGAYGAAGSPWSSNGGSTVLWRAVVVSAGVAVGFGLATATQAGLVKGGLVPGALSTTPVVTGYMGEPQKATGSSAAPTSGNWDNLVVLPMPEGDWEFSGIAEINPGGSPTTAAQIAISMFSGNTTTDHVRADNQMFLANVAAGQNVASNLSGVRFVIPAGGANVYLKCNTNFGGSMTYNGRLSARRPR